MTKTKAIRPIAIPPGLEEAWEAKMAPRREAAWAKIIKQVGGAEALEYVQANRDSVHETIITNIIDAHIDDAAIEETLDEIIEYIEEYSRQIRYDSPPILL